MTDETADPFAPLFDQMDAEELRWAEAAEKAAEALQQATDRMFQIQAARAALQAVRTEEPTETETKLAPTIRQIFKANGSRSFSAVEMRDAVLSANYTPSKGQNLLAAVHGVLKRMEEKPNQEIRRKTRKDGKTTAYVWASATTPLPPGQQVISQYHEMVSKQMAGSAMADISNTIRIAREALERARAATPSLRRDIERIKALVPSGMTLAEPTKKETDK